MTVERRLIRAQFKDIILDGETRYMGMADFRAVFKSLLFQRVKAIPPANTGTESHNVVARG
jgi:hypothetical protein